MDESIRPMRESFDAEDIDENFDDQIFSEMHAPLETICEQKQENCSAESSIHLDSSENHSVKDLPCGKECTQKETNLTTCLTETNVTDRVLGYSNSNATQNAASFVNKPLEEPTERRRLTTTIDSSLFRSTQAFETVVNRKPPWHTAHPPTSPTPLIPRSPVFSGSFNIRDDPPLELPDLGTLAKVLIKYLLKMYSSL